MNAPVTRPTLLLRLKNRDDRESWQEFCDLYLPMIVRFLTRAGRLQPVDAQDVAQDVMVAVSRAISDFEYDPMTGRFRAWLQTVTRNRLNTFYRKQQRVPEAAGGSGFHQQIAETPDADDRLEQCWEEEYRNRLLNWAMESIRPQVKPQTWDAFYLTAIGQQPCADVARQLGMSVAAVYLARGRMLERVRNQIALIGDRSSINVIPAIEDDPS